MIETDITFLLLQLSYQYNFLTNLIFLKILYNLHYTATLDFTNPVFVSTPLRLLYQVTDQEYCRLILQYTCKSGEIQIILTP